MRDETAAAIGLIIGWPPLAIIVLAYWMNKEWRKRHRKPEFIQGVDKLERAPWS
jgi:hypothetical protein